MNLYSILSHLHSVNRWLVLLFVVWAIVSAIGSRSTMNVADDTGSVLPKGALPAFITTHIQLLLGLILYFGAIAGWENIGSPYVVMDKEAWADALLKFYSVTHFSYMLAAVVLVTVGYIIAKRSSTSARSGLYILISYGIALVVMVLGIPWPWRGLGGGWY